ncbi:MAG: Cys-tRNA(Pro) deacylase [Spirochaetaceae bacterium]|jgi:Cys-tRNA(Pro)/Cys-tRNA(Cys) deacylase|nr:Cys-tRNA(Pro) deacylase [Spirochaetaceae bacterium]
MSGDRKTNVMRILEKHEIPYTVTSCPVDENHLDAVTFAERLGLPPEQVFKTIVMRDEQNGICVFCVPGNSEVSLKKARQLPGVSGRIAPVKQNELQAVTGYIRGGCSPIGMKKNYPTFIDETAILFDTIYVSAGVRGFQVGLNPGDLLRAAGASYADLTAEPSDF